MNSLKICFLLVLSVLVFLPERIAAQDFGEVFKAIAYDRAKGDYFGRSVAIWGDEMMIGSLDEEDQSGSNTVERAGSVYVYHKDATQGWQFVQKIVVSDRSENTAFASGIALGESYALIAAYQNATGLPGDTALQDAGAVYAFAKDSSGFWQETQKLLASDRAAYDRFGYRIAMHGSYAIFGAPGKDNGGPGGLESMRQGAAYLFERDSSGFWSEVAILSEADTSLSDQYGSSVAIRGNLALVGAPYEDEDANGQNTMRDAGAAYLYERTPAGQWSLKQKLVQDARNPDDLRFGSALAMKNDMILIGIRDNYSIPKLGKVFSFTPNGLGFWQQSQRFPAVLNSDIDPQNLSISGSFAALGQEQIGNVPGYVLVYFLNNAGVWEHQTTLTASAGHPNNDYGFSTCMYDSCLLVGAPKEGPANPFYSNSGAAYLYRPCTPRLIALSDSLCAGESYLFAGEWLTGSGFYTDSLLAASGCDSTLTLSLFFHPPVETSLSQSDSSLTALASGADFQWLSCANGLFQPIPGATGATFEPAISGWYAVAISQFGSCSDTSECVELILPSTGLEAEFARQMQLFPNPTSGRVQLRFPEPQALLLVRVLDLHGRVLAEHPSHGQTEIELALPGPAGLYLLDLRDGEGVRVLKKVVKW